jgi:hypothetical protein
VKSWIKIKLDAPKGWTRRLLLYVATPLALVGVTAAIASAGPMNPIVTSWISVESVDVCGTPQPILCCD